VTGVALAHCILGKFLGVVCHCFPPPLDVPTFAAGCLYVRNDARDPSSERWKCEREIFKVILPKFRLPRKFRDLLHAANLRHGTDGFTSPPKESVLRISRPKFIYMYVCVCMYIYIYIYIYITHRKKQAKQTDLFMMVRTAVLVDCWTKK
jgi:hypothetical protein